MASIQPAIRRITKRRDFLAAAAKGNKVVTTTVVLQAYPVQGGDASSPESSVRVGFTVTKKVGNAVVRNRIRRRMRAAVDRIFPETALAGWDYVLIGRWRAEKEDFDILLRDLRYAVRKAAKLEAARQAEKAQAEGAEAKA